VSYLKFDRLFEPLYLGELKLANRLVMPPMTTNYAKDGFVTDRMLDFYTERARGGAGLIFVEDGIVEAPRGRHTCDDLLICDDKYTPGLHHLAQAIKDQGARAAIQLSHAGRSAGRLRHGQLLLTAGEMPVAPSPIAHPTTGSVVPKELTTDEIEEIEDRFVEAACRAKDAGFDVIGLHCAHGYLIEQFLSPLSNQRQDAYGGDTESRFRFLSEIILKIKQKLGDDFPLMCRISGEELMEGGLTIEDARQNSQRLEACGIHGVSVSVGGHPPRCYLGMPVAVSPMRSPRGVLVHLAAAVKDVISIPVMTSNRIITPELAEQILEQDKADLIGIARGLIADPEWPKKAREGRQGEIRHCISCEHCFVVMQELPLACTVNPLAGREQELKITKADKVKTVFIAGGGPAGLEAARVAALRGHKVHLYEKDTLGGQLNIACIPPGKSEIALFVDFEQEQLKRLGVRIEHRELNQEIVIQERPDAVIVATGAHPKRPQIPGIETNNVLSAWQVLKEDIPRGKVVIIGGWQIGAETAEFLATKGSEVTIVEASNEISRDNMHLPFTHNFLLLSLEHLGVNMLTEATVEKITRRRGVIVKHKDQRFTIQADTVVLALGAQSDRTLANELAKLDVKLYIVGDCAGVGKMQKAITEGFRAGLAL
jgi:2,4-dienoyl-CoA reductase (NADPH2)